MRKTVRNQRLSIISGAILVLIWLSVIGGNARAQILNEDYESTTVGSLPASHSLVEGSAIVQATTQRDGSYGNVLRHDPGVTSIINLVPAELPDNVSISVDLRATGHEHGSVYGLVMLRSSANGMSGYRAFLRPGHSWLKLMRIDSGVEYLLSETRIAFPVGSWGRLGLETRGDHLRAFFDGPYGSAEAVAVDSSYASGGAVLGSINGSGYIYMDNALVQAALPLLSDIALLPLSSDLEPGSLTFVNNI